MAIQKYNISETTYPAKPRSKRRKNAGESAFGSSTNINVVNGSAEGHIHSNLVTLEKIGIDNDNYVYLTRKNESSAEEDPAFITVKIKAGYADIAKDISADSSVFNKFLRKDIEDTANAKIVFEKGFEAKENSTLENVQVSTISVLEQTETKTLAVAELAETNKLNVLTLAQVNSLEVATSTGTDSLSVSGVANLSQAFVTEYLSSSDFTDSSNGNGFHINDTEAWFTDLKIKKDSYFSGNLSSSLFVSGFPNGAGWALTWRDVVNTTGQATKKSHLELDDITVRGTMRIYEMIISQLLGENGTHLVTDMMKVKSVDILNKRIYLDTEEGALYNPFQLDDIIMVQRFDGLSAEGNGNTITKQYEFVVSETHIGSLSNNETRVDWIGYKNFIGDESHIASRDTLVRVDNQTNLDRKGIIKQTSVEPGSPYIDIIYGMKTDPDNATRSRLGRLDGIVTPWWGQLKGYGVFCDNFYGYGDLMLRTGEDVLTKFQVQESMIKAEIQSIRYDISEKDNFLKNASFCNNMDFWEHSTDVKIYNTEGKLITTNRNLYSQKNYIADVVSYDGKYMLQIKNSYIRQLNENIKKPEQPEIFYIGIRYLCKTAGTMIVGFLDQSLYEESQISVNTEFTDKEISGQWDGTGNFSLIFTGNIYIKSLFLVNRPMNEFKKSVDTRFEVTNGRIEAEAEKINNLTGELTTIGFDINALQDSLTLYASKTNELEEWKNEASVKITPEAINLTVKGQIDNAKEELESQLTIDAEWIRGTVSKINELGNTISNSGWITTTEGNELWSTKNEYNALNQRVGTAESNFSINADWIKGTVSKVDELGETIATAGWITTTEGNELYVKEVDYDGTSIVSKINQTADTVKISAKNIELDGRTIAGIIESQEIITGKLNVSGGSKIGGFKINGCNLENSDPGDGESSIIIRNETVGCASYLGSSSIPSTAGISCAGMFENKQSDDDSGWGTNVALFVVAKNAGSNIAIMGSGNILTNGINASYGYKLQSPSGANKVAEILISSGTNTILKFPYTNCGFALPRKSSIQQQLGRSRGSTDSFCIELNIVIEIGSPVGFLYGRTTEIVHLDTSDFPYRVDQNGEFLTGAHNMASGDTYRCLLVYNGTSYSAYLLSFTAY